jgi:hypothetical protein
MLFFSTRWTLHRVLKLSLFLACTTTCFHCLSHLLSFYLTPLSSYLPPPLSTQPSLSLSLSLSLSATVGCRLRHARAPTYGRWCMVARPWWGTRARPHDNTRWRPNPLVALSGPLARWSIDDVVMTKAKGCERKEHPSTTSQHNTLYYMLD